MKNRVTNIIKLNLILISSCGEFRPTSFDVLLGPVHMTLSQKSATVAENGETTATVAEFGDSRRFRRQCGQAFSDHVRSFDIVYFQVRTCTALLSLGT